MKEWLQREPRGKSLCLFIIMCVLAMLTYVLCFELVTKMLTNIISLVKINNSGGIRIFTFYFPFLMFFFAIVEEIIFRAPLILFITMNCRLRTMLFFAVLFSVIFGFLHGGIKHIFIQGVSGMMLSIAFLKCGGLQKKYTKALLTSTTVHYIYNMILVALLVLLGATSV